MKKGLLIILSGPSGVGKGTVREYIVNSHQIDITFSVSMTTRKPRQNEVDGRDYYFVSKEEFARQLEQGNLLEHATFVGNSYGTPKSKVESLRNEGKNVFLEIEVTGATQVLEKVKDDGVISFFLMPPSLNILKQRIIGRRTESPEVIQERLDKGLREIKEAHKYDYVIINDRVNKAGDQIIKIIKDKLSAWGNYAINWSSYRT